jgi:hypothetical protein
LITFLASASMQNYNKILLFTVLTISGCRLLAQDASTYRQRGDIHIGVDVLQSVPSFVFNKSYFIQNTLILEPVLMIPGKTARRSILISPGFTTGSTDKNSKEFISYQQFTGVYLKLGLETANSFAPVSMGFGPVISFASFKGRYRFPGPAFGDYEGNFKDSDNIAAGVNGYITYNLKLTEKWFVRFLVQGTISLRKGTIEPFYYPGLGFSKGNASTLFSPGFSAQVFRKVR